MEPADLLQQIAATSDGAAALPALVVAVIFQDRDAWTWAAELWHRLAQLAGPGAVPIAAWSLAELGRPQVFPQAVAAAASADVLVVALRAGHHPPRNLADWVNAWLPRRQKPDGALVALIHVAAGQHAALGGPTENYLRAVARRGRLDFLLRERTGRFAVQTNNPGEKL